MRVEAEAQIGETANDSGKSPTSRPLAARRLTLRARELAELLRAEPWLALPPAFVPREAARGTGRGLARLTPAAREAVIGGLALHQRAALGVSLRGWRAGLHIVAEYAVLGNRAASLLRVEAAGPPGESRRAGTRVRASVFPARSLPEEVLRLAERPADPGAGAGADARVGGPRPGAAAGETVLTLIPRFRRAAFSEPGPDGGPPRPGTRGPASCPAPLAPEPPGTEPARESFAAMRSWVVGASGWQTPIPDPAAGGAPRWLRVTGADLGEYLTALLLAAATAPLATAAPSAPAAAARPATAAPSVPAATELSPARGGS